ncbi:MAG TPA: SDR family NAD(P)-dependent oxidoreductase [Stackebrandtia sp.]|uniref:SDR family NAD(P)-dependent oxidoreductase n=1 Tax=Stackebrandtia sp. TaxID=2023065 RepID=UPI002D2ED0DA|nr:SDR family NAD(P)-dependent oxidoreductase [Stackebrandtia sp.]HZE38243.1 SDR family NAD(P)-dependent oxidoreductase [Stackebrandtia sp.]
MDDYTTPPTNATVLVTGATKGLGRYLVTELTKAGAAVLVHGRDADRVAALVDELSAVNAEAGPRGYVADLSDLDQVRGLAERVERDHGRLDALVHNATAAGSTDVSRRISVQGHELNMAVNHLAPLLLSRRLIPLLTASAPARIVNVASIGQQEIDFDDFGFTRGFEIMEAYCRSKLAMIMSAFDLAAELAGTGVTVNAVHPAHLMDTEGIRALGFTAQVPISHGGQPTLRVITDPKLDTVTGEYFNRYDIDKAHPQAYRTADRARLARISAEAIGAYLR